MKELGPIGVCVPGMPPQICHCIGLDVIERYQGAFYTYTNGDVLFDKSLILTLQMLCHTNIVQKDPFIIGRQTNYHLSLKEDTLQNLKDIRTIMSKPSAELFIKDAEDYFITTRNGFPWKEIPDFVIGYVVWDNWLVMYALSHYYCGMYIPLSDEKHQMVQDSSKKCTGQHRCNSNPVVTLPHATVVFHMEPFNYVIDATNTITCLHQSSLDGNYAGFTHSFLLDLNRQLAGQGFKFNLGKTDCQSGNDIFKE